MTKHLLVQVEELPEGGFMVTSEDLPDRTFTIKRAGYTD